MATLKELDDLEREVKLLRFIQKNLSELKIMGMTRAQWLDYVRRRVYPEYARPAPTQEPGVYRHTPQKVTPLRNTPYEVKRTLEPGEPGFVAQQAELERRWLAERRRKGYIEL